MNPPGSFHHRRMSPMGSGRTLRGVVMAAVAAGLLLLNARGLLVAGSAPAPDEVDHLLLQVGIGTALGGGLLLAAAAGLFGAAGTGRQFKRLLAGALVLAPALFFGAQQALARWEAASGPADWYAASLALVQARAEGATCPAAVEAGAAPAPACQGLEGATERTGAALRPWLTLRAGPPAEPAPATLQAWLLHAAEAEAGPSLPLYQRHYQPLAQALRERFDTDYQEASRRHAESLQAAIPAEQAWQDYQQDLARFPFKVDGADAAQRRTVVNRLHARHIDVADDWALDDRAGFEAALPQMRGPAEYRRRMDELLQRPTRLPPGLAWAAFLAHPDVQAFAKARLKGAGPLLQVPAGAIPLDADAAGFRRAFFAPVVQARAGQAQAHLRAWARGEAMDAAGRMAGLAALRAVCLPPLLLGGSLAGGLLALSVLVAGVVPGPRWRRMGVMAVLLGLMAGVPLGVDKLAGPAAPGSSSMALRWLARAEPVPAAGLLALQSAVLSLMPARH